MKKVFLICPVRNIEKGELKIIGEYVEYLELEGIKVHWPYRDTDQSDPIGNNICGTHRTEIKKCDEVHVWWNAESRGSHFDFGMAWMAEKPIKMINRLTGVSIEEYVHKSFEKLLHWVDDLYAMEKYNGFCKD